MNKLLILLGVIIFLILAGLQGYNQYLDIEAKWRSMPKQEVITTYKTVVDTQRIVITNEQTVEEFIISPENKEKRIGTAILTLLVFIIFTFISGKNTWHFLNEGRFVPYIIFFLSTGLLILVDLALMVYIIT